MKINESVDATDDLIELLCEEDLLKNFMYWYSEEAHPDDVNGIISKYLSEKNVVEMKVDRLADEFNNKIGIGFAVCVSVLLGVAVFGLWLVWEFIMMVVGS